jgi:hypothetical protein
MATLLVFERNRPVKSPSFKFVAVAALCLPLIMGSPAIARVPQGPALDSLSVGCKLLQNESDGLLAEYAGEKTPQRADDILARLRAIASNWDQICKGAFGSIVSKKIPKAARDALGQRLNGTDGNKIK